MTQASSGAAAPHLVLVGLMGTGKTTVGIELGRRLQRTVLDSDEMVQERTGKTIRQIFADEGEDVFRTIETEVLAEALASPEPSVIAAAGGVVLDETNRRLLQSDRAEVIWLLADPQILVDRVRGGQHRPLLDIDTLATLQEMHRHRQPLYREVADLVIDVNGRGVDEVVDEVIRGLGE